MKRLTFLLIISFALLTVNVTAAPEKGSPPTIPKIDKEEVNTPFVTVDFVLTAREELPGTIVTIVQDQQTHKVEACLVIRTEVVPILEKCTDYSPYQTGSLLTRERTILDPGKPETVP